MTNFRQRAAAWNKAKLASRNPQPAKAPEPVSKPVVEEEEIQIMEDAAEALEAEERAERRRKRRARITNPEPKEEA